MVSIYGMCVCEVCVCSVKCVFCVCVLCVCLCVVCMWYICVKCVCMCVTCVLRERVRGEKSVDSEHNLESLHLLPEKTTGVFCRDPQSHMSQGMGTPSNQAKFLPLVLFSGALGTFQK